MSEPIPILTLKEVSQTGGWAQVGSIKVLISKKSSVQQTPFDLFEDCVDDVLEPLPLSETWLL